MGSVFSSVTDAIGLTDTEAAKSSSRAASAASAEQSRLVDETIKLQQENVDFQRGVYEDWEAIYGPIRENLGEYYGNLDGDELTALGLQNQQLEHQRAVAQIERDAAQRGISESGIEFATKTASEFNNAEVRSAIRTQSDEIVAGQQLQFLNDGTSAGLQATANVNSAYGGVGSAFNAGISAYGGQFSANNSAFVQQQSQNQNAIGDLVGIGLGFL